MLVRHKVCKVGLVVLVSSATRRVAGDAPGRARHDRPVPDASGGPLSESYRVSCLPICQATAIPKRCHTVASFCRRRSSSSAPKAKVR